MLGRQDAGRAKKGPLWREQEAVGRVSPAPAQQSSLSAAPLASRGKMVMAGSGVASQGQGKGAMLGCVRGLWGPLIPAPASVQCNGCKEEGAIWSDVVGHSGTQRQKKKETEGTSLVVQRVRLQLPMQGSGFYPWSGN